MLNELVKPAHVWWSGLHELVVTATRPPRGCVRGRGRGAFLILAFLIPIYFLVNLKIDNGATEEYWKHSVFTGSEELCCSHSTYDLHRKEGNVLFNNALNTFHLRLYGIGHMVKDHSDSERGNPLLAHMLLFLISSKGSFICSIPQTG